VSRRVYTLADYRRDLAALDARRAGAPGLRVEPARQLTSEIDVEVPPVSAVVRRPTLLGVGVGEPPPQTPVNARVLAAVGLGVRSRSILR
jgi:hypothetical protein